MVSKIFSCSLTGLGADIIEVQADISPGMPIFSIVGLADTAVQESKERVRIGIKNSGAKFPQVRKTINLAPAQIKKHGSQFDLPIAIAILIASEQIKATKLQGSIIVGELSLNGHLKPVAGALAIAHTAKQQGFKKIFLPKQSAKEASFISNIEVFPVDSLAELIEFTKGYVDIPKQPHSRIHQGIQENEEFNNIVGLELAKRALIISAAGRHNALLHGAPGCGKTHLCRAYKELLPNMTEQEILETTKIYSISGLLSETTPIITSRPFREVHSTATTGSLIGGGAHPKPGEITLAHNGILFLDEIAEFPKAQLESLRQPLEDGYININRAHSSLRFPANFRLLATMNPCPCGYNGDSKKRCICSTSLLNSYRRRLSGPLLDRFDIFIEVFKSDMTKSQAEPKDPQPLIENAQEIQKNRFKNESFSHNSQMQLSHIKKYCNLTEEAQTTLHRSSGNLDLSNRAYLKVIKLAQTIADLTGSPQIENDHILEAIQYRQTLPNKL